MSSKTLSAATDTIYTFFDVKARNLNLDLVKFIRDSQNITPIMLLLDVSVPSVFKRIYYAMGVTLSLNHFTLKSFYFTPLALQGAFRL